GHVFNRAIQLLGLNGIPDTQCGFKLFRRAIAGELFGAGTVNGFAFDLEILLLARHRGYRIAQVPIDWMDQPGSKVRILRDGPIVFLDFLRIRRRIARGCYERPQQA
ncbi:MAG: glycosyltransferase family 2 protein, partial [Nitrospirae bacterium]|nr:glycosyltransferase family 2 protein [Nitrospirota bacterium]